MADKIKPEDNAADMQNPNKGMGGVNERYAKNQKNIDAQKNPQRPKNTPNQSKDNKK